MNLATPFTPTAEELEWYQRNCARHESPEDSATPGAAASDTAPPATVAPATAPAAAPSHTQSTAPAAPRAYPGSALTATVPVSGHHARRWLPASSARQISSTSKSNADSR